MPGNGYNMSKNRPLISSGGLALKYDEEQSYENCLAAIKDFGLALKYVNDP
jgi:hypothetical protein